MTRERINAKGEGRIFANVNEVHRAYHSGEVGLQARVKVRIHEVVVSDEADRTERTFIADTTVGRALLWEIVPAGIGYDMVNQPMVKKPSLALSTVVTVWWV